MYVLIILYVFMCNNTCNKPIIIIISIFTLESNLCIFDRCRSFPKDVEIYGLWKQICNFLINKYLRICQKHFLDTDYKNLNALQYGGKLCLKRSAFLSVLAPNSIARSTQTLHVMVTVTSAKLQSTS